MATSIHTAIDAELDRVVATAMLAFCADPFVRWVAPDPLQYLTHYPAVFRLFASTALENRTAYYAEGFSGIAVWLPPEVSVDAQEIAQGVLPLSLHGDAPALLEQMGSFHPNQPHWYLPLMGIEPMHQRQGLGSAMLKHALLACDRDQQLAYLEASSEQNLALYERHGFEVIGTLQAGSSPPIFPMLRQPR